MVGLLVVASACRGGGSDDVATADETADTAAPTTTFAVESNDVDDVDEPVGGDPYPAAFEDPDLVALPSVEHAEETLVWLTGEGRVAAEFVAGARALVDIGECPSAAEDLDSVGSPAEVNAAILGTPDEATREILLGMFALTAQRLGACDDGDVLAEFSWQWSLTERRLADLGIQT